MQHFPTEIIKTKYAEIFPHPLEGLSMEIFLEPFSLPDDEAEEAESELVDSSIRLDLSDLQDKVFTFPIVLSRGILTAQYISWALIIR